MNTSLNCATALSTVLAATLSPTALAELPPDVSQLVHTSTSYEIWHGIQDSRLHQEWWGLSEEIAHDGCCGLSYEDLFPEHGRYEGSVAMWGHAINSDGISYTVNSEIKYGCSAPDNQEVFALHTVTSTYFLRTEGTQAISLSIDISRPIWTSHIVSAPR